MKNETHPLQIVGSLVIDYFRWSQLAPMITVWFFALFMVLMLLITNHQDETLDGLEAVAEWLVELPVVGPALLRWAEDNATDDGKLHFGGNDFKAAAMKAWVILSLAFMIIGWIVSIVFGPFQPWTLKRKLMVAGLGSTVLMAGFVAIYYLGVEMFNGPQYVWMLNFAGLSLIVFLVSGWCLSIAHALGLLSRLLVSGRVSEPLP